MGNLENIFGALAIGTLSIVGSIYILMFLFYRVNSWRSKNSVYKDVGLKLQIGEFPASVILAIILPTTYGIGLVIQDFTDHLTDRDRFEENRTGSPYINMLSGNVSAFFDSIREDLGVEDQMRASSVLKNGREPLQSFRENCSLRRLNSLGREIFYFKANSEEILVDLKANHPVHTSDDIRPIKPHETGECKVYGLGKEEQEIVSDRYFCLYQLTEQGEDTQKLLCPSGFARMSYKHFKGKVSEVYYEAKNWAYRKVPSHYNELEEIQLRIDFSRSMYLILNIFISLLLLSVFMGLVLDLISSALLYRGRYRGYLRQFLRGEISLYKEKYLTVIFVLIFACGFSRIAVIGYQNAEQNYNERVFGYYSSFNKKD